MRNFIKFLNYININLITTFVQLIGAQNAFYKGKMCNLGAVIDNLKMSK